MNAKTVRRWRYIHTYSSLICTAFLLLLCVTGLPLIFSEEIRYAVHVEDKHPRGSPISMPLDLDAMIERGKQHYPGSIALSVHLDRDDARTTILFAPSFEAAWKDFTLVRWITFDFRNGAVLDRWLPREQAEARQSSEERAVETFMTVMSRLHIDLYAQLPGMLFLGLMGALFCSAIISGIVLYGPFTKRLDFGIIRTDRSRRLKWLDLHNLLGVVTLTWALVVGITGVINDVAAPLSLVWQNQIKSITVDHPDSEQLRQSEMVSPQKVIVLVEKVRPEIAVTSLTFPNSKTGLHHYFVTGEGNDHFAARLETVALVNARTGELATVLEMPWYMQLLELSRPLHFGDYGGLPMKILWALLDIVTIIVLASGLYLWLARRRGGKHPGNGARQPELIAEPAE